MYILKKIWYYKKKLWKPLSHNVLNIFFENCSHFPLNGKIRASKELFVTQPSVSNAIKALEEEFGVNLFYRNNNKLTLTPEGEKFYQNAEELLAHADAVRSELHELRKQITPVRIGIPPMLGTIYLPDMYLSLKEEFPDVDFRLY